MSEWSETTGKNLEIQVSKGQLLKNYHFVQLTELTDECIERIADAVVKKMSTSNPSVVTMKLNVDPEEVKKAMQNAEVTLLPADKKGKWMKEQYGANGYTYINGYRCSKCTLMYPWKTNYCPNCGARMEERDEHTD